MYNSVLLTNSLAITAQLSSLLVMFVCYVNNTQVCNHPDLFERRNVTSPASLDIHPYSIPRLLYHTQLTPPSYRYVHAHICIGYTTTWRLVWDSQNQGPKAQEVCISHTDRMEWCTRLTKTLGCRKRIKKLIFVWTDHLFNS